MRILGISLVLVLSFIVSLNSLANNEVSDSRMNCLRISFLVEKSYELRAKGATSAQLAQAIEKSEKSLKDQFILYLALVDVYMDPIPTDSGKYDDISFQLNQKAFNICKISYDITE